MTDTGNASTSKSGICEVCAYESAKYTCPRCEVKTCSLRCSSIHKKELECSGARDPTRYVPLKQFTNLDLSSDYRLLEDATRALDIMKRKHIGNRNTDFLPHYLHRLRAAAHNINLKFLPRNFDRRKQNTTNLDKDGTIYWHVEWCFPDCNMLKWHEEGCRGTDKLSAMLDKYFEAEELKEELKYYQSAGLSGVTVLLKAEQKKKGSFYELELDESLNENLKRKTIIEYPILYVVLKHSKDLYEIYNEEDDADVSKVKQEINTEPSNITGNLIIDKIVKTDEMEDSIYGSLKNLLFTDDYEDDEETMVN